MTNLTPVALRLQRILDAYGIEGIARELERATDQACPLPPDEAAGETQDRIMRIITIIERLQEIRTRFGNTCVYIRRGGLSWGAVALSRRSDDKERGVFDLQAEHDRDMMARAEQVDRLMADRDSWRDSQWQSEKTIAELEVRITRKDARIAELEALLRTWADDRALVMGRSEIGLV